MAASPFCSTDQCQMRWMWADGRFPMGLAVAKRDPLRWSKTAGPQATLMDLQSKLAAHFDDRIILTVDGKEHLPLKLSNAVLQLQAEVELSMWLPNVVLLVAILLSVTAAVWHWQHRKQLQYIGIGKWQLISSFVAIAAAMFLRLQS